MIHWTNQPTPTHRPSNRQGANHPPNVSERAGDDCKPDQMHPSRRRASSVSCRSGGNYARARFEARLCIGVQDSIAFNTVSGLTAGRRRVQQQRLPCTDRVKGQPSCRTPSGSCCTRVACRSDQPMKFVLSCSASCHSLSMPPAFTSGTVIAC
jgi:hypothetical protein